MIKTVATVSRLCAAFAFCGSIVTASATQATSIDFEIVPLHPATVDSYANLYPGLTFASNGRWSAYDTDFDAYDKIGGKVIGTYAGSPLSIGFQPAVRDVVADLAADLTGQQVVIGIQGYYEGLLVFSNYFATHPYFGSQGEVGEVRAQTTGIVDQLVIARTSGIAGAVLDNLSFTTVPEPTGWMTAGIAIISIGHLTRRSSRRCLPGPEPL